jgi:hypothetical protein
LGRLRTQRQEWQAQQPAGQRRKQQQETQLMLLPLLALRTQTQACQPQKLKRQGGQLMAQSQVSFGQPTPTPATELQRWHCRSRCLVETRW